MPRYLQQSLRPRTSLYMAVSSNFGRYRIFTSLDALKGGLRSRFCNRELKRIFPYYVVLNTDSDIDCDYKVDPDTGEVELKGSFDLSKIGETVYKLWD